jgi:hypothetical protein
LCGLAARALADDEDQKQPADRGWRRAAVARAPVFVSEWGYSASDPNPHAWGTSLQSTLDGDGASWTAWVTDNAWSPSMFADASLTTLTDFGTLVKIWPAATASSDWVQ